MLEIDYPTLITGATVNAGTDLPNYLKYVFDVGIFLGFFSVFISFIWAGVLYLMSPAMPSALSEAKDRVGGAFSGLLILITLYLIITTINPALKIFRLQKLDAIPSSPAGPATPPGVYFHNSAGCADSNAKPEAKSISDLGDLKNRVNSVNIVQHPSENLYYIAILYDLVNQSGMCKYINPNTGCQKAVSNINAESFADSASIYQYNFFPNDDGVYFYRKSFFNAEGGWLKIDNSSIKNAKIFIEKMENLSFTGYSNEPDNQKACTVPKEDQDCAFWDKKENCKQKKCPSLGGENITSIRIKGNYLVLLIYFDEAKDQRYGTWSFCQAFPAEDDITKNGPNQIKWEAVRNTGQQPNYVAIIPVKQK